MSEIRQQWTAIDALEHRHFSIARMDDPGEKRSGRRGLGLAVTGPAVELACRLPPVISCIGPTKNRHPKGLAGCPAPAADALMSVPLASTTGVIGVAMVGSGICRRVPVPAPLPFRTCAPCLR